MKKMILCSFAVASVIGTYLLNESTTYESPCLLANVEALARDEGNSDLYIRSSNGFRAEKFRNYGFCRRGNAYFKNG